DLATQDYRFGFRIDTVFVKNSSDSFLGRSFHLKDCRDHRSFSSGSDDVAGGFLARQQIEARTKLNRRVIDNNVVLQPQFEEHGDWAQDSTVWGLGLREFGLGVSNLTAQASCIEALCSNHH